MPLESSLDCEKSRAFPKDPWEGKEMEENELIETVSKLIQLDIDTVCSYNQALDEIEDQII